MSEIVNAVSTIKTGVLMIKGEIDSLKNIQRINIMQLPAYSRSMDALNEAIDNFEKVYCEHIPKEHLLRFALIYNLETEINKFKKNLKEYSRWAKKIESRNCCCIPRCWNLITKSPSKMEKLIENIFKEINPIIKEFISLQDAIFGTAIKIEHPILRQAWMQRGLNELNSSSISSTIFCQYIYYLLKREENNNIKCEKFCMKTIQEFVNKIDKGIGNVPDGLLLPMELNEFKPTKKNTSSVKAMLNIDKLPVFDISDNDESDTESISNEEIINYDDVQTDKTNNSESKSDDVNACVDINNIIVVPIDDPVNTHTSPDITNTSPEITNTSPDITNTSPEITNTSPEITNVNIESDSGNTNMYTVNTASNSATGNVATINTNNINTDNSNDLNESTVFVSNTNNDSFKSPDSPKNNNSSSPNRGSMTSVKKQNRASIDPNININMPCDIVEELDIKFTSIMIKNTQKIKIPYCEGYGCNWPSEMACEFDIPNGNNATIDKYEFHTMSFDCIATDQGWGGTGHTQVRVQINDQMPFTVFSIWMDKNEGNKYNFLVGSNIAKVGDHVKIWLCCPPWSGWKASLEKLNGQITFHKKNI
jgi:hypothetical protein